jgi:SAM-dependent methyltransferase
MQAQLSPTVVPVCPHCRGKLLFTGQEISCTSCEAKFQFENGFPDLIVGGRFDDEDDPERTAYETQTNEDLTRNYFLPVFSDLFKGRKAPRLLSLGCGVGMDVDLLTNAGFDVYGIDCGNRTNAWPHRRHRDRLYLANGKHLPFDDQTFDMVYCGCVFPHVGVEGDSNIVRPDGWEERCKIASEMTRVLKPGGRILVSSPNRWFPFDLFHGRDAGNPWPRFNPPTSRFLLSAGDYRTMFQRAGCNRFTPMPVQGYWGFLRMKQSWKGRLLAMPVETVFRAVSTPVGSILRTSPINPWLVMLCQKGN